MCGHGFTDRGKGGTVAREMPATAQTVKRIDQQRHELKALRYLLEICPDREATPFPSRDDFQIADCRAIYDVLAVARTQAEAIAAIEELDLGETDVDSFLGLGGKHYHTYPKLVVDRAKEFRTKQLAIVD